MKVLIIHGPNLNLLDRRNPHIYGDQSLNIINNIIELKGKELGFKTEFFQSNHEGEIIDKIQEATDLDYCGIIINPAALTHYSLSIRDSIEILDIPVIEVHLSNINSREEFRAKSVIAPVCKGQISGLGVNSYLIALNALKLLNKQKGGG